MKITGIGNAIVDVICKVDEEFLTVNKLTKSNMKLIDESELKKLLGILKLRKLFQGDLWPIQLLGCLNLVIKLVL